MTKLTETALFKISKPRAETAMEKTSRAVTEILDEESEKRRIKTDRLRKARLERGAGTPVETPKSASTKARKTPRTKAVKKS